MDGYKRIEKCIGRYIADHYRNPVEIGVRQNFAAAEYITLKGIGCRCTDIKPVVPPAGITFFCDDIFSPDPKKYSGTEPSLFGPAGRGDDTANERTRNNPQL